MSPTGPIVLFVAELSGNGVARNTVYLARALKARRLEVEVVCLGAGPLAAELGDVPLTELGRGAAPRAISLLTRVQPLRRLLVERAPALVVSMGNHAHLCLWAALRGLPDIRRAYRVSNDPRHPGEPAVFGRLRDLGLALVAADADRLACVSAPLAGLPVFGAARRQGRVAVTTNGVDVQDIRRRAQAPIDHPWVGDEAPYLIAVGRIHRQKGFDLLLRALAQARRTDPTLRLLIVGGGKGGRIRALRDQARRLGLGDDALRLEGECGNPFPLLASASAFVLPSRWEGASNALLEALACGVPVVAARSAGSAPQVLEDGRFGRLVDPEDADALAHAILAQASPGAARIEPGDRIEAYALPVTIERLAEVLLAACEPQLPSAQQLHAAAAA